MAEFGATHGPGGAHNQGPSHGAAGVARGSYSVIGLQEPMVISGVVYVVFVHSPHPPTPHGAAHVI